MKLHQERHDHGFVPDMAMDIAESLKACAASRHAQAPRPALSRREWLLLGSAYLSQYVAYSFFFVALMAILRGQGMPLERLGWVYLLGLVSGLKFLWAPLMDRHGFGPRGHYGAWLALMQVLLVAALLALAALDVRPGAPAPLGWLMAGCALMAFLTASQDIAADGLSCRLLGPAQRGLGNALQMAGGMAGFAVGGGAVLMLYERWGWRVALLSLTTLNLLTLAQALLYREPPHARPSRADQGGDVRAHWRQLRAFWQRSDTGWRWAVLMACVQFGVCMAYGVLTPMLVDAGWEMGKIGRVINIYGSAAGVAAMLALGLSMRRWPPALALRWMLPAQVLAVALLAAPLLLHLGDGWVLAGVAAYLALYMPLGVLVSTLMMGKASAHAPATDFSMQYGVYVCASFVASALALPLAATLGYGGLLALAAGLGLLMAFAAPRLFLGSHCAAQAPTGADF